MSLAWHSRLLARRRPIATDTPARIDHVSLVGSILHEPRTVRLLGLLGVFVVAVLIGVQFARPAQVTREQAPELGCMDVAAATGLTFRGAYGDIYPTRDEMGRIMQRNMGNGAAVGDYDGDGYLDVFLGGQAGQQSRLFRNVPAADGSRSYVDVTTAAGLNIRGNVRVAQFVDLGSGRPDLVVATDFVEELGGEPSGIFRNNGDGTFVDVTAGSGFDPMGYIVGGMTFADYDHSGRQSIYLSYWTQELAGDPALMRVQGAFPGMNRLYRNLGDYRFDDVTYDSGLGATRADSFTAIFADFTGDRQADIYQASDHRPDRFYVNQGGHFRDSSEEAGLLSRAGNSMGVAAADLTGSGGLDLYVTQITDPGRRFGTNTGNTLMVSRPDGEATSFRDDAGSRGIVDSAWGWGTAFVDANLDGALDIYAVQGMREFVGGDSTHIEHATSKLFINDGSGMSFTAAEDTGCDLKGDQRALVVFDYNRDGSPDLLVTQVDAPTLLLENRILGPHWLTVQPAAPGDGGIGARVSVTVDGRTTHQLMLAGGSYLAGPPRELYFGLGDASAADLVRVEWVDGTVTDLRGIAADRILSVAKP